MTTIAEKVIWALAIVVLIPVLLNPATALASGALALGILAVGYGTRLLYGTYESRRQGERGRVRQMREREGRR